MSREIVAVDLFCGAGGFSEALQQVCEGLGYQLRHAGVNHWDVAVESHAANHPESLQINSKVEQCHPPDIVEQLLEDPERPISIDILTAGPECTHFSSARGGKPVKEQKRSSPWDVLNWLQKLSPSVFCIENVKEIQNWGVVKDGEPTRDGTIFDAWVDAINALGYSVDWTTLNAADFGDPTSRERFFLIGRKDGSATWPEPTHDDEDPNKPDQRTAAEIIDWSDRGQSIWTRDLTESRVHSPPKDTTMKRVAEGIRRHCDDRLEPFAKALETLGRDEIRTLREDRVVPRNLVAEATQMLGDPFLVPAGEPMDREPALINYYGMSSPQPVDAPIDTVTSGGLKYALADVESYILRQQDGWYPSAVSERPVPTIATRGGHALTVPELTPMIEPKNGAQRGIHSNPLFKPSSRPIHTITSDPRAKLVSPCLTPLYNGRDSQRPRTRAVDRPLMTVPASKSPASVISPSLVRYSHGGTALSVDDPMPTIATERGSVFAVSDPTVQPFLDDCQGNPQLPCEPLKTQPASDRYALVVPELGAWGLDIKYRMLQPRELKKAQGFPEEYYLAGNKSDKTTQIGNAVPVNLASALIRHLLTSDDPSLATYGGGISREENPEIQSYEEIVAKMGANADD